MRVGRLLAVTLLLAGWSGSAGVDSSAAQTEPKRPNVVVILTDDQRHNTLATMPEVQEHLIRKGVSFSQAFASNSICCPARATFLTGNYAHTTGVYSNLRPFGNMWGFRHGGAERSTLATWLQASGYRTSFMGKYMNTYTGGVPPGWDEWRALVGGSFTDYVVNVNGRNERSSTEHVSDYLTREATEFIERGLGGTTPFLLYVSTPLPHAPATPLPAHADAFPDLAPYESPAFNEEDVSDKPAYVRGYALRDPAAIEHWRIRQLRSLLGADQMVGAIVDTLAATGQLTDTIVVYTSDNGMAWGDHRLMGAHKAVPYESSIRVPFIVRYDRLAGARRVDGRLVTNADLAPTLADLGRAKRPPTEGRSLGPLLAQQATGWRSAVLLENQGGLWADDPMPSYCGVRLADMKYVLYNSGEEELYDLAVDPFELQNRAADAGAESRRLVGLAAVRKLCFPTPPGYRPAKLYTVRGGMRPGTIKGGPGVDHIRSRSLRDTIVAGAGNDTVDAQSLEVQGLARATFTLRSPLGPGGRIYGGPGHDRINVRNGRRDVTRCGKGNDLVVADRFDRRFGCEGVRYPYRR